MRYVSGYDPQLQSALYGFDLPPMVPNVMDDEFNDGSFDTTKWTWLDQGSWTASEGDGRLSLVGPASDGNRIRGIYQTLPATPWAFRAKLYMPASGVSGQSGLGLIFLEDVSNDVNFVGLWGNQIRGLTYATPSSAAGSLGGAVTITNVLPYTPVWVQAEYDGTDYIISATTSPHGGFIALHTTSPTWTPTLVGLGVTNNVAGAATMPFGWFRRVL